MPASRQTLMGRNPPRPAVKKKGICGICGEDVIAATLVRQRNTLVSRLHQGCLDNPRVYEGPRVRGPHYGGYPVAQPLTGQISAPIVLQLPSDAQVEQQTPGFGPGLSPPLSGVYTPVILPAGYATPRGVDVPVSDAGMLHDSEQE